MSRQVFIVYRHPLFGDAIRLLLTRGGIRVLGMESDWNRAREQIEALHPNVVLMEVNGDQEFSPVAWLSSIRSLPDLKQTTIAVSFQNNHLFIWQKEERNLIDAVDLVEAIRSA